MIEKLKKNMRIKCSVAVGDANLTNQIGIIQIVREGDCLVKFSPEIRGHHENYEQWWVPCEYLKPFYQGNREVVE